MSVVEVPVLLNQELDVTLAMDSVSMEIHWSVYNSCGEAVTGTLRNIAKFIWMVNNEELTLESLRSTFSPEEQELANMIGNYSHDDYMEYLSNCDFRDILYSFGYTIVDESEAILDLLGPHSYGTFHHLTFLFKEYFKMTAFKNTWGAGAA